MDPAAKPSGVPFSQAKEDEIGMYQKTNCVVGLTGGDILSNQHEEKNKQYMPMQMETMTPDDGEIVLLELWQALAQKKMIILIITIVFTLAGVGYIISTTPIYEAEVYFLPPTIDNIDELKVASKNIIDNENLFTIEMVYNLFLQNIRSRDQRIKFFKQEGLSSELKDRYVGDDENRIFEEKFNEELVLNEKNLKRGGGSSFYSLRFRGRDASRTAELANNFVSMVMSDTRDQLVKNVMILKENRIKNIEKSITTKRNSAVLRRNDEALRLMEALEIAKKLKIAEDKFSGSDVETASAYNIGVSYLRGTKTLSAQLESLQNRKSDDPFISDLRELQEKLDSISVTTINPEHIQVSKIDQPAIVPGKPIKPKKGLVIALAGGCGFFLGIFTAFFLNFVQKVRKEEG